MPTEIESLKKRLAKLEEKLEKVRGASPISHGWQSQKYARASRSWDVLAQEKMRIRNRIDELESNQSQE